MKLKDKYNQGPSLRAPQESLRPPSTASESDVGTHNRLLMKKENPPHVLTMWSRPNTFSSSVQPGEKEALVIRPPDRIIDPTNTIRLCQFLLVTNHVNLV